MISLAYLCFLPYLFIVIAIALQFDIATRSQALALHSKGYSMANGAAEG